MCKAVSLRIVNGRLCNDKSIGKVTCYTHNGESVVDYLLTSQANFNLISNLIKALRVLMGTAALKRSNREVVS